MNNEAVIHHVMLAVVCVALLPAASAPANPPKPPKPAHLKVLVLDVNSEEFTEGEKVTIANLEAAHLSEEPGLEVLSGQDLKQLVALQGDAEDIGVNGHCTDACMAELAGTIGAGVVVATQVGKLGDTIVVTLSVFDAAKARSVSRKSFQVRSLGELPARLGPALDALVRPLLPAVAGSLPAQTPASPLTDDLTGWVRSAYDAEAFDICVGNEDPVTGAAAAPGSMAASAQGMWWFCDHHKRPYTENAFVRKYRTVTGAHDIDRAEVDRGGGGGDYGVPIAMGVVGAAGTFLLSFTLVCGLSDCGSVVGDAFSPDADPPLGFIGGTTIGAAAAIAGLAIGMSSLPGDDHDGTPSMHTLTEAEARAAAARFNGALRDRAPGERAAGGMRAL